MNLAAVMNELGDALDTIDGLRVFRYPAGTVSPPAAVIAFPDSIEFETAYQRGAARITIPIALVEGDVSNRSSALRLGEYASGSGDKSVKAAIDDYSYSAIDVATVVTADFDIVTIGDTDHIGCLFEVDVIGSGT